MANTLNFDEQFYLTQNPDVAAAVSRGLFANGADHYNQFGRFEARNPNAFFDTSFYLAQYPDVAAAGINPLTHFLNFGVLENRATNATELGAFDKDGNGLLNEFDAAAYLTANQDVANGIANGTIKSAYQHFIQFGQFEGRVAPLTDGTTVSGPFTSTGGTGGSTIVLTANTDIVNGTTNTTIAQPASIFATQGADTFVASDTTITAGDQINGLGGVDTLKISAALDIDTSTASITNVEVVELTDIGTVNTADLAGVTDLTTLNINGSNDKLTVSGVKSTVTTTATNLGDNLTLTFSDASATGSQATTLRVAGATAGTLKAAGIETVNLVSTGAASTLTGATFADATDLNVTANAAINLGAVSTAAAKTIDIDGTSKVTATTLNGAADTVITVTGGASLTAGLGANVKSVTSTSTGSLDVALGATTTSVTGSAANDRVDLGTKVLTTGKIAGGDGVDTLKIADSTDTLFTADTKALISGFEVLEVGAGSTKTYDFTSLSGLQSLVVDASTSAVVNNLGASTPVTIAGDQTTGLELNVANATSPFNSSDSLTLTLDKTGTATATSIVTVANLKSDGLETLNIVSSGVTGNDASVTTDNNKISSLSDLSSSNINKIVITGASDLTLVTGDTAHTLNIDGSGATGNLTIDASSNSKAVAITAGSGALVATGSAAADILTGGAGNDTIDGGAGNDTIVTGAGTNTVIGGAGADKITLGSGVDTITHTTLTDSLAAAFDTVTGFAAGTDKIDVTNVPTVILQGAGYTAAGTGTLADDIGTALTNGAGTFAANAAAYVTISSGDDAGTYLIINNATAGYDATTDAVIKMVGLTGTLALTDFV